MTHPQFPVERLLSRESCVNDPYLFDTVSQWKYAESIKGSEPSLTTIAQQLRQELLLPEMQSRLMAAVSDVDERPRIQAFECLVELEVEGAEGICANFLHHTDEYDRYVAAELALDLVNPEMEQRLLSIVNGDPDPYVVAAACRSLQNQKSKRKTVAALLNVVEKDWVLCTDDQRMGPKMAALYSLDSIFGTSYISQRLSDGIATFAPSYLPGQLIDLARRWLIQQDVECPIDWSRANRS